MNSSSNDEVWLESDSEAISVPGKKYYEVNSLYVLVTDTPVPVHSNDSMDVDSCNGDYVDQDSDSEVIPVPGKNLLCVYICNLVSIIHVNRLIN